MKFGLEFDLWRFGRSIWCQLSFSRFNWVVSEPKAIFQFDGKHQSYHDRTKFKHVHKHAFTSILTSPICPRPLNLSDMINSVNLKLILFQFSLTLQVLVWLNANFGYDLGMDTLFTVDFRDIQYISISYTVYNMRHFVDSCCMKSNYCKDWFSFDMKVALGTKLIPSLAFME